MDICPGRWVLHFNVLIWKTVHCINIIPASDDNAANCDPKSGSIEQLVVLPTVNPGVISLNLSSAT